MEGLAAGGKTGTLGSGGAGAGGDSGGDGRGALPKLAEAAAAVCTAEMRAERRPATSSTCTPWMVQPEGAGRIGETQVRAGT